MTRIYLTVGALFAVAAGICAALRGAGYTDIDLKSCLLGAAVEAVLSMVLLWGLGVLLEDE